MNNESAVYHLKCKLADWVRNDHPSTQRIVLYFATQPIFDGDDNYLRDAPVLVNGWRYTLTGEKYNLPITTTKQALSEFELPDDLRQLEVEISKAPIYIPIKHAQVIEFVNEAQRLLDWYEIEQLADHYSARFEVKPFTSLRVTCDSRGWLIYPTTIVIDGVGVVEDSSEWEFIVAFFEEGRVKLTMNGINWAPTNSLPDFAAFRKEDFWYSQEQEDQENETTHDNGFDGEG